MKGNSFGKLFTVTTFGESHGPYYGCIIDGCPPLLPLTEADIQTELDKRKPGASHFTSQRREADLVKILSGVFEGQTTGTPIGLLIENTDAKSKDYTQIKDIFRPGHADFTYQKKYGIRDYRGGGRASARETMMRVAAGAIAKKYLKTYYQIHITAYLTQIGDLVMNTDDLSQVASNPFFCPDLTKISAIEDLIHSLRKAGDSIGAKLCVEAKPMPIGLGQPVFDGLDASLAHALMSINAVKGVEIGDGFSVVRQRGSYHRDEMTSQGFLSNHSGGTLGGISSGQTLRASVAFKPTSSIPQPAQTIDISSNSQIAVVKGRHDTCVAFRAVPIVEAMVALVLMDFALLQFGSKGSK